MRYVVFSKSTCPFCISAQELLSEKEMAFKVVNFEPDQQQVLQEIKDAYQWPTVPMIFRINDDKKVDFIGGYTDLCETLQGE